MWQTEIRLCMWTEWQTSQSDIHSQHLTTSQLTLPGIKSSFSRSVINTSNICVNVNHSRNMRILCDDTTLTNSSLCTVNNCCITKLLTNYQLNYHVYSISHTYALPTFVRVVCLNCIIAGYKNYVCLYQLSLCVLFYTTLWWSVLGSNMLQK